VIGSVPAGAAGGPLLPPPNGPLGAGSIDGLQGWWDSALSTARRGKGATIADIEVGAVIEATVQRITPYGAFLQLEDGKVGLVHISEIDRNYVRNVEDHLHLNDRVQAKVVAIKEDGKIDLSIKALQDPAPRVERQRGRDPEFEQKLKRFMRQSEERQVDFKRSVENKRK
jgi:S1 RNA binding domain protein